MSENGPFPDGARPLLGLALGGGAARGWAHIGVLRQLKRAGFEPDVIAGTSAGAVVGACYLAGRLDALESWTRALTPRRVRQLLDWRWTGGGLFGGERLTELLAGQLGAGGIEDLPKPFAAIATELRTGHEIWLRHGSLVQAVRASFALPGVFTPVDIGGRLHVDGALLNPCPTSAVRAMGARVTVSVSLHAGAFAAAPPRPTPSFAPAEHEQRERRAAKAPATAFGAEHFLLRQLFGGRPEDPTIATVMVDALSVLMDRVSNARLASDPPDVLIAPRCAEIGLLEFARAEEIIALGEEAAYAALPQIEAAMRKLA